MEEIVQQLVAGGAVLDASEREFTDEEIAQLCAELLKHGAGVTSLDLHEANISDSQARELAMALEYLPNLHDLSLCWNAGLTSEGMAVLLSSVAQHCKALKDLYLAGNEDAMGNAGVELLAKSGLLAQLQVLDLGECGVGLEGAVILANHLPNSTVRELSLGLNREMGDDGLRALCGVLHMTLLESLDLTQCQITDTGAVALGIVLNTCASLREVRLNENELTDAGAMVLLEAVKQSAVLAVLDLEGNESVSSDMQLEVYKYLRQGASSSAAATAAATVA